MHLSSSKWNSHMSMRRYCQAHQLCCVIAQLLMTVHTGHVTRAVLSASHFSHVQLFMTVRTVACQAPLSMGFSRQKY